MDVVVIVPASHLRTGKGLTVRRRGELMEYANAEADACVCLAFIEPPLLDDGARTFWRHHT